MTNFCSKPEQKDYKRIAGKLRGLKINYCCTDHWLAFAEVLPKETHIVIGKEHPKKIEGINAWFRTRLYRLVGRTICCSKKLSYH